MLDQQKKIYRQAKKGRPRLNETRKVVYVRVSEKMHSAYLARGGARWSRTPISRVTKRPQTLAVAVIQEGGLALPSFLPSEAFKLNSATHPACYVDHLTISTAPGNELHTNRQSVGTHK